MPEFFGGNESVAMHMVMKAKVAIFFEELQY